MFISPGLEQAVGNLGMRNKVSDKVTILSYIHVAVSMHNMESTSDLELRPKAIPPNLCLGSTDS